MTLTCLPLIFRMPIFKLLRHRNSTLSVVLNLDLRTLARLPLSYVRCTAVILLDMISGIISVCVCHTLVSLHVLSTPTFGCMNLRWPTVRHTGNMCSCMLRMLSWYLIMLKKVWRKRSRSILLWSLAPLDLLRFILVDTCINSPLRLE